MAVNSELERMCKKVSMALIKLLSHHMPGGSNETKKCLTMIPNFWIKIQTKNWLECMFINRCVQGHGNRGFSAVNYKLSCRMVPISEL
jgi:hypothetical protein